jgi:hypothetical protein
MFKKSVHRDNNTESDIMQTVRRRPVFSKCHVSQYRREYNSPTPLTKAQTARIFTKHTNAQRHYMQIFDNDFHRYRMTHFDSADSNSYVPKNKSTGFTVSVITKLTTHRVSPVDISCSKFYPYRKKR